MYTQLEQLSTTSVLSRCIRQCITVRDPANRKYLEIWPRHAFLTVLSFPAGGPETKVFQISNFRGRRAAGRATWPGNRDTRASGTQLEA